MSLEIIFTNSPKKARSLTNSGFEPIECAFGQHGSVLGPLNMDHHGTESHREGVAIRACRDHYGERRDDPRFVVTGAPDADAVLAIIALAGLVDHAQLPEEFYQLVDRFDVDPIGIDLFEENLGVGLAWFNHLQGLEQSATGFYEAIEHMTKLLTSGLSPDQREKTKRTDAARRRTAERGVCALLGRNGDRLSVPSPPFGAVKRGKDAQQSRECVVVTRSPVWGFDVWYRMAPIVVSFAERIQKITVGVADKDTAEDLFGEGGLMNVWRTLGKGWGGRESVGGSPRGVPVSFDDTVDVAHQVLECLPEKG